MSETNGARSDNGSGAASEAAPEPERLRLGGMAMRNGLLIHGPRAWAAAARAPDGSIEVASGPKPAFAQGRLGQIPGLRGPLRLAEAMAVVPIARSRLRSARLPMENGRVLLAAGATMAANVSHAAGGSERRRPPGPPRGRPPSRCWDWSPRSRRCATTTSPRTTAVSTRRSAPTSRARSTRPTAPKEHDRCGSNLIVPMLAFSVAGQVAGEKLVEKPGPITRLAAGAGAVSAAVELFVYADRNPRSAVGRARAHGRTRDPAADLHS